MSDVLLSVADHVRNRTTTREATMAPDDLTHHHTPEEERRIREAALDRTLAASFPASDPPSSTPNPDDHTAVERESREGEKGRDTEER